MTEHPASPVRVAPPRHVHLIGIGGMHMSAIAQLLLADGVRVSGSDIQETDLTRRLASLGAAVRKGHAAANVDDADLVVMTAAVKDDNAEVQEARRRGIPVIMRAEMVARLMQGRTGVALAGTHGKTTTSAMVAHFLKQAGRDPTYLLGGESLDLGTNAAPGSGPHIVVEADEYARAFLEYRPRVAAINNIEPDHLDYYGSVDAIIDAFRRFIARIPADGTLVANADSPLLAELLAEGAAAPIERFRVVSGPSAGQPLDRSLDWLALDEGPNALGGRTFLLLRYGQRFGRFESPRPFLYNMANAAAAIAVCARLGLTAEEIRTALRGFRGARRRFQLVGEARGVTVIDDYAHHPTAARATIAGAKEHFPGRRVVVLFQPHTYSRTAYLLDQWRTCFAAADALYLLDTYAARETPAAGMSAVELVAQITHPPARFTPTLKEAIRTLKKELKPGDVLITMGAGDVTDIGPELVRALR